MLLFSKKDNGNKKIIEQVILENYSKYYHLAYSYVHNDTDASDIVQNGAYKAIKSSHTLKQPKYAETWVYRIMINECFQYLKQPTLFSYEAIHDESGVDVEYVEDNYLDIDLWRAVDMLQDKDKAIVILKYFEDMKLEDIAYILDENVNTIKSRLYRSLKKMRDVLSN